MRYSLNHRLWESLIKLIGEMPKKYGSIHQLFDYYEVILVFIKMFSWLLLVHLIWKDDLQSFDRWILKCAWFPYIFCRVLPSISLQCQMTRSPGKESLQALAIEDGPTFSQLPKYFVTFSLSRPPLLHSNSEFGELLCWFFLTSSFGRISLFQQIIRSLARHSV